MSNLVGQVLLNQFRVDAFLASGGMGAVYRVWDTKRNVSLAMKVLHADLLDDPSAFKYFQREARALQKLRHPNVVPFYGLYQTEEFAFILEQFIDGPSLNSLLRKQPSGLPISDALTYLKALCSALGYAHANGIIHCDIKPANVMIDRGGQIYLADFGIARHAQSTTTTIAGAGTPAYMAPEQIRGEQVIPATDVYALGVLLFELLTGKRPFRGDEPETISAGNITGERIRHAHLYLTPPDPRTLNPSIPPIFAAIILKCLSKSADERYSSTSDLLLAISASGIPIPDRLQGIFLLDATSVLPSRSVQAEIQISSPARKPLTLFAASVAVIIFLIIVGLGLGVVLFGKLFLPSAPVVAQQPAQATATILPTDLPTVVEASPTVPPPLSTETPVPAGPMAGDTLIHLKDGATLIYIPEGEFKMGLTRLQIDELLNYCRTCRVENFSDAMPLHPVYLDAYWIYKYEVTNRQYRQCVDEGVCSKPVKLSSTSARPDYYTNSKFDNYPAVFVDWMRSAQYCAWAGGALPTEAQWEKAARGTADTRLFPWGNQPPGSNLLNFDEQVGDTTPVDSYPAGASPYGVLNMSGNVYEWIADWYGADYYTRSPYRNPPGPDGPESNKPSRVVRGGNWYWAGAYASLAFHDKWEPEKSSQDVGFRCVILNP